MKKLKCDAITNALHSLVALKTLARGKYKKALFLNKDCIYEKNYYDIFFAPKDLLDKKIDGRVIITSLDLKYPNRFSKAVFFFDNNLVLLELSHYLTIIDKPNSRVVRNLYAKKTTIGKKLTLF